MDHADLFRPFAKIPRYYRDIIITEKIDGTNAAVVITEDGRVLAQSRTRMITPENDNFGFAAWVKRNEDELRLLGPGHHFGEWWGVGIQRGYGLHERRFSLFNTSRWAGNNALPSCCHVVPDFYRGHIEWDDCAVPTPIQWALDYLRSNGSLAAPGYGNPEGIIVYHTAANSCFKVTLEKDDEWKGKQS